MIFREPILSFSRHKPLFALPLPQLPPDIPENDISEQPPVSPQTPLSHILPPRKQPEYAYPFCIFCIICIFCMFRIIPYLLPPIFLCFVFFLVSPIPAFSFSSISPDSPLCFSISVFPFSLSHSPLFPDTPDIHYRQKFRRQISLPT